MSSRILSLLLSAGALTAAVTLFVMPAFEEENSQDSEARPATSLNAAVPEDTAPSARRQAFLSIRDDGHYWARTVVNRKASVDFMVDTGASTVAVTQEDARRMGFRPDDLDYTMRIRTPGGETLGAEIFIDSIKVGQVEVRNVHAMVMREELEQSLLGMSFLRELYSYEFRGDRLILRQ